ncbi:PREDICTED: uncharacterized protein LOC105450380 [Wasmannia auropunctata]|uniref:uncharacterized protein LOC105450380 n=1 Tax=Wasmannia auropunctata TaxID=64793 RepID=UPI0005ED9EF2|nr:PREDICTED: uncharacterized protein LOC105450380 [Wasmannia auropunctata]
MENVHNHVDVRFLTKWEGRFDAEAMIAKPNFHSRSVSSENLIAIEMRKLEVKFNKPTWRYDPCMLTQHIDNSENAVMTSVESRIRMHLEHIPLPQIIVSANYDASLWKISSRGSVQFLDQLLTFS